MKIFSSVSKGWNFAARWVPVAGICALLASGAGAQEKRQFVNGADIQAALDALPKSGGEVVLPPGEIMVMNPIVLARNNLTLRGAGDATVLKLANRMSCPVVILGTIKNKPTEIISGLRLADLAIDGNKESQKHEKWDSGGEGSEIRNNGVTVRGVRDCTVERVTAYNCRSGGLVAEKGVTRLKVDKFTAYGNQFDGLAGYRTTDSTFTHIHCHSHPKGAGISIDLSFNGNVISDAVLAENDLGIFMRESNRNVFNGIVVRKSINDGIFMAQADGPTPKGWGLVPGTECIDNVFNGLMVTDCGGAAFRAADVACTNNAVSSARFLGNKKGGIIEAVPGMVRRFGVMGE